MRTRVTSAGGKAKRDCEGDGAGVGVAEGWAMGRPWRTVKVLVGERAEDAGNCAHPAWSVP